MARPFLTARWCNLFLASYPVLPELLRPRLPVGLELDLLDGQAFVSLVAFQFLDTRVLGVPWPGYRNFAELNLRFYVRQGPTRGVTFIREFVPQRLTAWIARVLYNEPYLAAPLGGEVRTEPNSVTAQYWLDYGGRRHTITVRGTRPGVLPGPESVEHHFKEHQWGFGTLRDGRTIRYEVGHPVWEIYPVREYQIDVDWAGVYGPEWGFLAQAKPFSAVFASGSAVKVFRGEVLNSQPATGVS